MDRISCRRRWIEVALFGLAISAPARSDSLSVQVQGTVQLNAFSAGHFAQAVPGDPVTLYCEVALPGDHQVPGQTAVYAIDLTVSKLQVGSVLAGFSTGSWLTLENDNMLGQDQLSVSLAPLDVDPLFLILSLSNATGALWDTVDLNQVQGTYGLADFDGLDFTVLSGTGALVVDFDRLTIHEPIIGTSFCSGDGSVLACPCGNGAASGEGCANSLGLGGLLEPNGSRSVTAGDLGFAASQLIPDQAALLFVGTSEFANGQGLLLGDGLRCATGTLRRLTGVSVNRLGQATWADLAPGFGGWSAGDVRVFQVWYVDGPSSPCGSGFNFSNGVRVEFAP